MLDLLAIIVIGLAQVQAAPLDDTVARVTAYAAKWPQPAPGAPAAPEGAPSTVGYVGEFETFRQKLKTPFRCAPGPVGRLNVSVTEGGVACAWRAWWEEGSLLVSLAVAYPREPVMGTEWMWGDGGSTTVDGGRLNIRRDPETYTAAERAEIEADRQLAGCGPRDLTEALACLHRNARMRSLVGGLKADALVGEMHMSLGLFLRNNWGLWADGPLAKFFRSKGRRHPDDMSGIIMRAYWMQLQGCEVDLEAPRAIEREFRRMERGQDCAIR